MNLFNHTAIQLLQSDSLGWNLSTHSQFQQIASRVTAQQGASGSIRKHCNPTIVDRNHIKSNKKRLKAIESNTKRSASRLFQNKIKK